MTPEVRAQVRERAGQRCEYCRYLDLIRSGPFDVEHIRPRSEGGTDNLENLAWSCDYCNGHKAAVTSAVDPVTGEQVRLFHPRLDRWNDHFLWSNDYVLVIGRTPTGRATVERLHLNREPVKEARQLLLLVGKHPPPEDSS